MLVLRSLWHYGFLVSIPTLITLGSLGLVYGQDPTDSNTVKIVSSMPMTGSALGETQTIVNAIQQAIDERDGTVCEGRIQVEFESYDDSTPATGGWDPEQVRQNATQIVEDPDVIAVIGHYNSGATAASLPIFNEANLAVVSPSNTYPGLTKPGKGEPGEPDVFFPTGVRNYARVVPTDDLQGAVAARWAKQLGVEQAFVIDDSDTYGIGIADEFEAGATAVEIEIVGRSSLDPTQSQFDGLVDSIQAADPDLIYFGGTAENRAGELIRQIRDAGITEALYMVPDAAVIQLLIEMGLRGAEGTYGTFGGVPISGYEGAAKGWYERYQAKYQSEPQPYAIYGFEATNVVLAALDQVCTNDRDAIRQAVLNTRDYNGVLGQWSFDPNGDTSLSIFSGYQVRNGQWEFLQILE